MVNIHFLPCASCAFIFFCAFIPSDLLKNPHAIFASLTFLLSSEKRSGPFLLLQSKSSPSSAPHYFLIPSCSSSLGLCLVLLSLSIFSGPLLSHPFKHTSSYLLPLIHSPVQWSWLWRNKAVWGKKKKGKCPHAHAQSLGVSQCRVRLLQKRGKNTS